MSTYSAGIAAGITFAAVFLIIWILFRRLRGKACEEQFDERQLYARGRAYQAGFLTFTCCICIDACLKMFGTAPYEDPLGEFTALFIAVTVFAIEAIRHDAFKGFHTKSRNYILLYFGVVLAQLVSTVSSFLDGRLVEDGILTLRCVSPVCMIAFTIILILLIRKSIRERSELAEES